MFKISIGITKGIAEFDGVGAAGGREEGDDERSGVIPSPPCPKTSFRPSR